MLNYQVSQSPFYSRKLVVVEATFEGFCKPVPNRGKRPCTHVNCGKMACTFTRFQALTPTELATPGTKPLCAIALIVASTKEVRGSGSVIFNPDDGVLVRDIWFQVGHSTGTVASHWYPHSAMTPGRFAQPSEILELPEVLTALVV